uniref:Neuregulin C-terminal domain-containing protein n=1 Tax=Monopterus albus TaxID=43700 RepID=A0A3Q3JRI0_MONAL
MTIFHRKSKEVYKRQVLSITSIALVISLLGTLCMALYYTKFKNNIWMFLLPFSLRSGSLSHSPNQITRVAHWSGPRRTPPIPRGRLNPIGGSKYSGPAYQHLQEMDSNEKEPETILPSPWSGHVEVRSGPSVHNNPNPATRSLRRPSRRHNHSPPPPFRSCSIPIIPSVQCYHDNEVSCMQTSVSPATTVTCEATPYNDERRGKVAHSALPSSSCSCAIGQQQDEVALLLEQAQEHLRALALAHRKQEEGGIGSSGSTAGHVEVKQTVCFLTGGSAGMLSCNGPTQTLLLSPSLSHTDRGQTGQ